MSTSLVNIGVVPGEEDCAATGVTDNAGALQRLESRAYISGLRRKYGEEPEGVRFQVKGSPHDFGTYYEAFAIVEDDKPEAWQYARKVEDGLRTWEEVGMWPPVTYDDDHQPVLVLRAPELWLRATNPQRLASLDRPTTGL